MASVAHQRHSAPPSTRVYLRVAATVCAALLLLTAWLWRPFVSAAPMTWYHANELILVGLGLLTIAAYVHAAISFSPWDAAVSAVLVFCITWGAEAASLRWGGIVGFGYAYHPALQPCLPGGVPVFVVLAWCVLARVPLVLLRSMPLTDDDGRLCVRRVLVKTFCCAAALAAWDLLLDPLAVSAGLWTWHPGGTYYGIPAPSILFWFLVGCAVYLPYFVLHRLWAESIPERRLASGALCAVALLLSAPPLALAVRTRVGGLMPWILWMGCMAPWWGYWLRGVLARVTLPAAAPVAGTASPARSMPFRQ